MEAQAYSVIVVGGGHAGVEAAWAAANLLPAEQTPAGRTRPTVALVTLDASKIGEMSCNPAIGGLAKGQLVREIDAMGGLMAHAADATGLQFKVLNTSKGAAVHGPRAQCDRHAYARWIRGAIARRPEIRIIQGAVEEFILGPSGADGARRVRGVRLRARPGPAPADGSIEHGFDLAGEIELHAPAVVLTTGTFMRGLMHTGESRTPGGRAGEAPAGAISAALVGLGLELGRLKTGTPPRLRRASIDWEALEPQVGDDVPVPFSDLTDRSAFPLLPQHECRLTWTTAPGHEAIRRNLHRAPMFSGQIESRGPRYCPSIEDKVVRFADKPQHQVFLEPEGLGTDWVYCNGIATSLPEDVQRDVVRTMPGCERAEIIRYGYAVEYDMVRPHQIIATGACRDVRGLFLAGQINGTSGYEEAGAQGLVAGAGAALSVLGREGLRLGRDTSYIGVLMDDLVTKTPVEPYRMFTSRAEHRLLLRADNSADRLTPLARALGLLETPDGARRWARLQQRRALLEHVHGASRRVRVGGAFPAELARKPQYTADDLLRDLRAAGVLEPSALHGTPPPDEALLREVILTLHTDLKYEPYVDRERAEIARRSAMESRRIPPGLDEHALAPMRTEARQAILKFRPETLGQAGRLEGVTPTDVTLLAVLMKRRPAAPAEEPA